MSDFESRVRDAIAHGTDEPATGDLVGKVHEKARARRRRTTGLTVALAVAAVVTVALVTAQLTGPDRAGDDTTTTTAEGQWKWESWHGVQVQVPADWVYGSRSQWCTMSSRTDGWKVPRVWRSDQPETKVRCSDPVEAYGLTFFDTANIRLTPLPVSKNSNASIGPVGSWVALVVESDVGISISAPDRETADRIVASVEQIEGADANGCPPQLGGERDPVGDAGSISVCRYDDGRWLSQSERLEGDDAAAARAALDATPVFDMIRPCAPTGSASVLMVTGDGVARLNLYVQCEAAYWAGDKRELTADLLYWALSPGFMGGLPGDIPVPSEPRR